MALDIGILLWLARPDENDGNATFLSSRSQLATEVGSLSQRIRSKFFTVGVIEHCEQAKATTVAELVIYEAHGPRALIAVGTANGSGFARTRGLLAFYAISRWFSSLSSLSRPS